MSINPSVRAQVGSLQRRYIAVGLSALTVFAADTGPLLPRLNAGLIDFEDITAGAPGGSGGPPATVAKRYFSSEVTFENAAAFNYAWFSAPHGFVHSGTKAIEPCYGSEFCAAPLIMNFTRPQRRVKVWVGYHRRSSPDDIVVLRAFNVSGVQVGVTTATAREASATPMEILAASADIARATVGYLAAERGSAFNNDLVIDDVEILAADAPVTLSTLGEPGPSFRIRINSPPNQRVSLETSPDLRRWSALGSAAPAQGVAEFSDPASASVSPRFYRARLDPLTFPTGTKILVLQGLRGNTLVAGKTTALRLFTDPVPVESVDRVTASVLRADGSRVEHSWPKSQLVRIPRSGWGASLVVMLPGAQLPDAGRCYFTVKLFTSGQAVATYSVDNVEFKPTRDLRVLVDRIWSFTPTKPREIEAAHEAMQRMSWIYPVRDGVSALDGDRSAGLRYLLNNNPSGPPQQDGHVCPLFASYRNRPAGYDNMDVGILYRFPNEGEGCGANGPHQCANVGVNHSTIVWRESLAHVFAHETGHCFGLVNPNAPHFDPSGQASHSRLETIDVEESDLGFNLQFNRPFPSPTLDLMFPTGPCPGEPAEQSSLHPYDWEFLRQKLMQLPSTGPAGPSVSWQGLGGVTPAPHLAVGKNADGRQEVFMLGMDRALYHQWELTPGGAWSGWVSLGGTQLQGPIAVANHADGRLEVYVRGGDGYLYFRNQIVPNGNWNGWSGLGGGPVKDFTVARNSDGRLELVAVWTDGTLRDVWQVAPNGGWSGWASLGGTALAGPVAFGQNADGRLEAFAVGGDGIVYHQWQTIPSSGPWSGWRSLAHASLPAVADLAINRTGDGRLFLLLMRADRSLSYRMQTTPNGGWGDAVNLWGHSLQWPAAVAQRPDGRLEVLVIGGDRQLYSRWQVDSARPDVWADWLPLGGTAIQPGVTIGYTASGDVDAYVIGGDGALYRGPRR